MRVGATFIRRTFRPLDSTLIAQAWEDHLQSSGVPDDEQEEARKYSAYIKVYRHNSVTAETLDVLGVEYFSAVTVS